MDTSQIGCGQTQHSASKKLPFGSLRRLLLALVLAFCLTGVARAQDDDSVSSGAGMPDTEAQAKSSEVEAGPDNKAQAKEEMLSGKDEFLKLGGKPQFQITSLEPAHGPVTGNTEVIVRGYGFLKYSLVFPEPKCRYGPNTQIVSAAYVSCAAKQRKVWEAEATKKERTATCIQCEGSPPSAESKTVMLQVSLVGDFSDVIPTTKDHDSEQEASFYYYKQPVIKAIKPIHGPKGGGTHVQVWGENFIDFGDSVLCSFGVRSVKATVQDSGYVTCSTPASDVVSRAQPFSLSLNGGKNQADGNQVFWYYPLPQVTVVEPASGPGPGPENGGNEVVVRGNNYAPFHTDQGEPDISNSTFCSFVQLDVLVPATILNSTRAVCIAPPSYYYKSTPVEITLNAQQRTDDGTLYFYYKPPFLFDVEPRQGPVRGGTVVTVMGTNFNATKNITCKFGHIEVSAVMKSSSEIKCTSPKYLEPGTVELSVSLLPGLFSTPVSFLYYETPVVNEIYPPCGPFSGFTQIVVKGKNFLDLGSDLARCVFNGTQMTNATVVSSTMIICDSPSLLNKHGQVTLDEDAVAMHNLQITLDGGKEVSEGSASFRYYKNPDVNSISPALSPLKTNTPVVIQGSGFAQSHACKHIVRVGLIQVEAKHTSDTLSFEMPPAFQAGTVVVSVSLNGQQFTRQQAVHSPQQSLTYDFYRDPYVSLHHPIRGPTNGGTPIKVQGFGFQLHRQHLKDQIWARFVDTANNSQEIAPASLVKNVGIDQFEWVTPATNKTGDVLLQISLNKVDWHDVKDPAEASKSFTYYASPHILSVTPSFGHVKSTKDQVVELKGTGFECFDSDSSNCPELKCRFGNSPEQYVYVQGQFYSQNSVKCKVPQYTKPDVLNIELTINDESFTNDNKTFGFFDPFVLDAYPRLIAIDGSTQVEIQGIGFVDSGETKALFSNRADPIVCGASGSACSLQAKFIDKRTLLAPTFPQSQMKFKSSGKSIESDGIYVDATVIGEEYTQNEVKLFYYQEPTLTSTNINQAPSNLEAQLIVMADFGTQNKQALVQYGQPKCRFSVGSKVKETDATLLRYPFTASVDPSKINAIHCKTPQWQLDGHEAEKVKLDLSVNGKNFAGALDFTFTRPLKIHRDIPMAAPRNKLTNITIIGEGFVLNNRTPSYLKYGVQSTDRIAEGTVSQYTYSEEGFINTIQGNQELKAYFGELGNTKFKKVDSVLQEGGNFYDSVMKSQRFLSEQASLGGPAYLEVGLEEELNHTVTKSDGSSITEKWILHNFEPSMVEFYSYKEPSVLKMHPLAGLTKGGTFVEVIGTWFRYMPEYGIVPHCRFGDKIVRAHFDSTVRLVCQSPPGSDTTVKLPFEVSLNGVDWSKTGFTFSYYEEPIMTSITPDLGNVQGGEEVFIKGEKFSSNIDADEFKCKFTPTTVHNLARTVRAKYVNSTHIMCTTPGGWTEADHTILQVTWNGVDYDENNFMFSFYSIHQAFPRSGPSNGLGGDIIVTGAGFQADKNPTCKLNGTQSEPTFVNSTTIKCKMPAAEDGPTYFGNVDFSVSANGFTWHQFEGGFQYYEQPIVDDVDPKKGPNTGVGIINFYGSGFRADYSLAQLGCRLGNAKGQAYYVSPRQVKCVVEDIPLLTEDQEPLSAQVSLNSYSYTEVHENTIYRPYGILSISPTAVPFNSGTTIIVNGRGFVAEEGITPRCRFGTPANYAISQAEILSYNRLACRAPDTLPTTPTSGIPRDVPFAIALSGDEFAPWTKSIHRVLFYTQPQVEMLDPVEGEVGRVITVFVTSTQKTEFFDPPARDSADKEHTENQLSPLKCKFGRFGESQGIYINSTTVKCTTPATDEPPENVYREKVEVTVAMNGKDFLEGEDDLAEFTFVGTAPYISFVTILLLLLALLFAGGAAVYLIQKRNNVQEDIPDSHNHAAQQYHLNQSQHNSQPPSQMSNLGGRGSRAQMLRRNN